MKPRLNLLPMTEDDTEIWHCVVERFHTRRVASHDVFVGLWRNSLSQARRDADLMLALTLTGSSCGERGICTADLFAAGCVIYNTTVGMRIAIRAYPGQVDHHLDGITYFA